MVIALEDRWIWDSWYVRDGADWHGFVLTAPKSLGDPELRHFNVTQHHFVSKDLREWRHLGEHLRPSEGPAFDDLTVWTGSVVQGDDGRWHLFYTGGGSAEKGLYQRIGHAVSDDLHRWERVDAGLGAPGLCLDMTGPVAEAYEKEHALGHWHDRAMRDPWVMRDPEGEGWLMYFTARVPGREEPNEGGAIGFATSPNLMDWTLREPVFAGCFGQLEVPQVFEVAGRWYCLFCTSAGHWSEAQKAAEHIHPVTGSHYLIGEGPRGPWRVAPGFLDGDVPCRRYASRIVDGPDGLVILGFRDGGRDDFHGYVMDPEPVVVNDDGTLSVVRDREGAE